MKTKKILVLFFWVIGNFFYSCREKSNDKFTFEIYCDFPLNKAIARYNISAIKHIETSSNTFFFDNIVDSFFLKNSDSFISAGSNYLIFRKNEKVIGRISLIVVTASVDENRNIPGVYMIKHNTDSLSWYLSPIVHSGEAHIFTYGKNSIDTLNAIYKWYESSRASN